MKRVYLIEPVVALYAFAMFMTYPLLQQFVYRRLWQDLTGSPFPSSPNVSHCSNNYSNQSIHKRVQMEASLFFLQSELCFLFPSLIISLLLVSYSDHSGRKAAIVPPLVGDLLFGLSYFIVSYLSLNLRYLLLAAFLTGFLGGPASLLGGCFAYVADCCSGKEKAGEKMVRMAGLDMLLGVLSGLASLCTGFFISATGFSWPFLTAALLHLLNLFYVFGALQESMVLPDPQPVLSPPSPSSSSSLSTDTEPPRLSQKQAVMSQLQGVYLLFATSTRRRKLALGLNLAAFTFYKVANVGGFSIFILYELNTPLCWDEVFVGYGSAFSTAIFLGSFAGVWLLSRCLRDPHIVLIGLISVAAGFIMTAFAKTTLLMFLVRLPLLLSIMPTPVFRSMMSKLVTSSEQGAMFACVSFVEMLSMGLAYTIFSSIYAATVYWFSGFSFLLAAGLSLVPAALIGALLFFHLDVDDETSYLTSNEETESQPESFQLPPWDPS
ncbi:solute carrier family 46 member 3 [Chanos chanos]|uniref:Solute carrier family 46 member 3 n=1 Tax=Chanos chanos TaxID=29144 RepID=A0A6J2WUV8_CHACN|nr:solute carrier family 46 member 3-like [Chanos chanos]